MYIDASERGIAQIENKGKRERGGGGERRKSREWMRRVEGREQRVENRVDEVERSRG